MLLQDKRGANSRSFQSRSKGKKMLDLMLDGEVTIAYFHLKLIKIFKRWMEAERRIRSRSM